jgi:hypothetical protein
MHGMPPELGMPQLLHAVQFGISKESKVDMSVGESYRARAVGCSYKVLGLQPMQQLLLSIV